MGTIGREGRREEEERESEEWWEGDMCEDGVENEL